MRHGGVPLATHARQAPEGFRPLLDGTHRRLVVRWHRVGAFRLMSVLQIIEQFLEVGRSGAEGEEVSPAVYLPDRLLLARSPLPAGPTLDMPPLSAGEYHVYVSRENAGAPDLVALLQSHLNSGGTGEGGIASAAPRGLGAPAALRVTDDPRQMLRATHFLLLLGSRTTTPALFGELRTALANHPRLSIVLAHEQREGPAAAAFDQVIAGTPSDLTRRRASSTTSPCRSSTHHTSR
mmetsp:Transcript_13550/g.43538  ORF Transcript_13550/g.43538 Transcript_13550/m.43538 type:complete len:236 (+) Transcript_13550:2323-3030(+)